MTTMQEAVEAIIDGRLEGMHVCLPGRVERYDARTRKADVAPAIQKRLASGAGLRLPVLTDVPVVWPSGGGGGIHFPLRKGDGVMVIFAERSIENFLGGAFDVVTKDSRKFALSDAIAVPGLYPFSVPSPAAYSDTGASITFGGVTVKMGDDGKLAIGKQAAELLDIVSQALGFIATGTTGAGPLSTAGQAAALKVTLDSMLKGTL